MLHDMRRYFEFYLGQDVTFLRRHYSVNATTYVQDDVVITGILFMFMNVPITRFIVNLDVTNP